MKNLNLIFISSLCLFWSCKPVQNSSNDVLCGGVDITHEENCFDLKVNKIIGLATNGNGISNLDSYFQTSDLCFRNFNGTPYQGVEQPNKAVCQLIPHTSKLVNLQDLQINFTTGCNGGTIAGQVFTWNAYEYGPCTIQISSPDLAKKFSFEVNREPSGQYLTILGGTSNATALYNPTTGTFSAGPSLITGSDEDGYNFRIKSGLHKGKTFIVPGNYGAQSSLYNPVDNTIIAGPVFSSGPAYGGIGFEITSGPDLGKFFIVHGANTTSFLYDPSDNSVTDGPTLPGPPYNNATGFMISSGTDSGKFIFTTGNGGSSTLFYDPIGQSFSNGPATNGAVGCWGAHNFAINSGAHAGKRMFINGSNTNATSIFDPATSTFSAGPTLPANAANGGNAFTIKSGVNAGKTVIIHGSTTGCAVAPSNYTSIYDPVLNSFSVGPTLSDVADVGSHSLEIKVGIYANKFIVIHGGLAGNTTDKTSIFHPENLSFSAGPTLPAAAGRGAHSFALP